MRSTGLIENKQKVRQAKEYFELCCVTKRRI
jgi:hypothetical protein